MDVSWDIVCDLTPHVLNVIDTLGFETMTPVQVATIPAFMKNKDVCVEAITGSGKTLAFVIPLLEMLLRRPEVLKKHQVGALIVSPTRELASQIFEVLKSFIDEDHCSFKCSLIIGGMGDIQYDLNKYEETGSNIIVATPGRINFALEKNMLLRTGIRSLEVLILDEADRLLDLGFHRTLTSIMRYLPKQRRTGLFSATQTTEVEQLIKAGMRNPVKISVKEKDQLEFASASTSTSVKTPSSLNNQYTTCQPQEKFNRLMNIIMSKQNDKILIFFATCASVDYFGCAIREMVPKNVQIMLLHGRMRRKRLDIFNKFRKMTSGILICTDVMARGVDIPDVDWVLQYDPPSNASAFVHRCGRTARVGKKGNALVFLLEMEAAYVDFIEMNQKAPMLEYNLKEDQSSDIDWLSKLRNLAMDDRMMLDKGMRAFVSFIQYYGKHDCSLIFRVKDLSFGELATGFALLKMPRMPELKYKKITGFETVADIASIPYKNKVREQKRQTDLKRPASEIESRPKYVSRKMRAFSENRKKREKKKQKKEKRILKKEKTQLTFNDDELEELRQDALLVKKLRRGHISKDEYDQRIETEEKKMKIELNC